jgi:PAS domain-containing protein
MEMEPPAADVLLLDFDQELAALVKTTLEFGGLIVVALAVRQTALSVSEWTQTLAQYRPQVVVAYVGMPAQAGWAALSALRQAPGRRSPAWVLTTKDRGALTAAVGPNDALELRREIDPLTALNRAVSACRVARPDPIILLDRTARVMAVSPAAGLLLGCRPETLLGRAPLDLIHPEDHGAVITFVRRLLRTPGASGRHRCRLRSRDNAWRLIEVEAYNGLDTPYGRLLGRLRHVDPAHR